MVWIDDDRDGEMGSSEEPLAGVVVRLVDPSTGDEIVDEAVTGGAGSAELVGLQDLLPGYAVAVVVPPGHQPTTSEVFPLDGHDYRTEPVPFGVVATADG
jgi:hypothetical protein